MKIYERGPAKIVTGILVASLLACGDRRAQPEAASAPVAAPAVQTHAHDHAQHQHPEGHAHEGHAAHALPADTPLAARSLYHVDARFTDQHGGDFALASLRGSAVLSAMFYASCTSICPMLVSQVQRVHAALPPEQRARTQVLLISLDPARDDTQKLSALAKRHGVDDARWHFVRTSDGSVREIAAALGVRYRAMPDGEISHSPLIALLDHEGELLTRMENAAGDPAELIAATARAASAAPQAPRARAPAHAPASAREARP